MSYFPLFIEMEHRPVLIIGGGRVAWRKVTALLSYGADISVAAPSFCAELLAEKSIRRLPQRFEESLLDTAEIVIAATDDVTLNHTIAGICRARHIPVNVVDDAEACSFLFPSLVREGNLSIGISTGGASPSAAIWIKKKIRSIIPANIGSILAFLQASRSKVRHCIADESERADFYTWLLEECLEGRYFPADGSLDGAMERFHQEEQL